MLDKLDVSIIEILLNSDKPVSSKDIAFLVGKSSRTIRNRSHKINDILNEYDAKIDFKPGIGLSIAIEDVESFDVFWKENALLLQHFDDRSFTDDLNYLIQLLVSENDYITIDEITELLHISQSKVSLLLKDLRNILDQYDLTLKTRPHYGMKIVGKEIDIRRFISSNYVQKNWMCFNQFTTKNLAWVADEDKVIFNAIAEIVKNNIRQAKYQVSSNVLNSLIVHLFITTKRNMVKNVQLSVDTLKPSESANTEFKIAENMIKDVEEVFEIKFPEFETNYIAMHLIGKKTLHQKEFQTVSPEVNKLVEDMLQHINAKKNINLLNDFNLRIMLALHIVPLVSRIEYGIDLKNPIIEQTKINCMAGYDLAILACALIEDQFKTELSDDEISYFAIHFDVALQRQNKEKQLKDVLIVCSTGRASAELLRIQFQKHFSEYIKSIEVCDVTEMELYLGQGNYDFIFTTVPISKPIDTNVPIFEFSFFLDNKSIKEIEDVLLFDQENLDYFQELFDQNQFFVDTGINNKSEAIDFIINQAQDYYNLDDSFKSLIKKRESMSGTDLLPNVALLHPSKLCSKRSFVSVLILDEPIFWETYHVQIVFLISIGVNDSNQYRLLLDKMIKLSSSNHSIRQVVKNKSFDSLMHIINKI